MKLEDVLKTNKFKNETHKAGLNILYTAWWIKTISARAFKQFDLTQEQYNVLRILKGSYPSSMVVKDIACRMIEKNSNVPRIVDRLEIKNLITRTQCNKDGRQTQVVLTQKGIALLEQSTLELNNTWDSSFLIDKNDAETISNLLEKFRLIEKNENCNS